MNHSAQIACNSWKDHWKLQPQPKISGKFVSLVCIPMVMPVALKTGPAGASLASTVLKNVREILLNLAFWINMNYILKLSLSFSVSKGTQTGSHKVNNAHSPSLWIGIKSIPARQAKKALNTRLSMQKRLKLLAQLISMCHGLSSMANTLHQPKMQLFPIWSNMYVQSTLVLRRLMPVDDFMIWYYYRHITLKFINLYLIEQI